MRRIDLHIQRPWLHRRGLRGRILTAYVHVYGGVAERTERMHTHPWLVAIGIVLRGWMLEYRPADGLPRRVVRKRFSIRVYTRNSIHAVARADGTTLFVGLFRTRRFIDRAATVHTAEGWCHYTEIMPDEPGFNPEYVEGAA